MITPNQLRRSYLDFFIAQGHVEVPSSPLVPDNDPTTLFTGSGMQPMITYLLGEEHPKGTRIVDSQKCFRSQDIEEVGDNRHTTFFEMLGNWSLGDYFKQEQLRWFFTWLTDELGLDPQRLYVSVYAGNPELGIPADQEAIDIWQKLFTEKNVSAEFSTSAEESGMGTARIFAYGDSKNWWSRAGEPKKMPVGEPGGPDSETFYDFGAELGLHEKSLFSKEVCHVNCDCGRFMEIGNSVFMTYLHTAQGFEPLKQKNIDFGGGFERILAAINNDPDVFKTELFTPIISRIETLSGSKYDSSDTTKRSMRVMADHLRAAVVLASDGVFPSNKEQGYFSRRLLRRTIRYARMIGISETFLAELVPVVAEIYQEAYPEIKEQLTIIQSAFAAEERKFDQALRKGLHELDKVPVLDGEMAFRLYETYGFPFELSQEIAAERGQTVALADFEQAKKKHAAESRTASAGKFKGGLADHSEVTTKYHTATHLLHAALRQVVGKHVEQKGSNITAERLRFDFSQPTALTAEQISAVEQQINAWIKAELPVTRQVMAKTEALNSGAIAFFLDKYPDEVSVYTVGNNPDGAAADETNGWISKEFCGGPHVSNTAEIGPIKLTKEQSASAGVRRIYIELA